MNKMGLATALFGMLLLSIVGAPLVNAGTLEANKNAYFNAKEKYLTAKSVYNDARANYLDAQGKYKANKNKNNEAALTDRAREYLTNACDYAIKYLEATKTGLHWTGKTQYDSTLDGYISWFSTHKSDLTGAATVADVKEHAKQIKNEWTDVRFEVKKILVEIMVDKTSKIIDKSNAAYDKASKVIDYRKGLGEDVSEVESLLSAYKTKIAEVEAHLVNAQNAVNGVSGIEDYAALNQADNELREANKDIKVGYSLLQQIKDALTPIQRQSSTGGESGKTLAGHGWIRAVGEGTVDLSASEGTGFVDGSGTLEVSGVELTKIPETWTKLSDGVYEGSGRVEFAVTESTATVRIVGNVIEFSASGEGSVTMSGEGKYWYGKIVEGTESTSGMGEITNQPVVVTVAAISTVSTQ